MRTHTSIPLEAWMYACVFICVCLSVCVQVDNNAYMPIFSFGMVLWATLFNVAWRRTSAVLAFNWGTLLREASEEVRGMFVLMHQSERPK